MEFKINGTEITKPKDFTVRIVDIDEVIQMADGSTVRDVISTKRQIDIIFDVLSWSNCSNILSLTQDIFIEFNYPDPLLGTYTTKTFSIREKTTPFMVEIEDKIFWDGLSFTLLER